MRRYKYYTEVFLMIFSGWTASRLQLFSLSEPFETSSNTVVHSWEFYSKSKKTLIREVILWYRTLRWYQWSFQSSLQGKTGNGLPKCGLSDKPDVFPARCADKLVNIVQEIYILTLRAYQWEKWAFKLNLSVRKKLVQWL